MKFKSLKKDPVEEVSWDDIATAVPIEDKEKIEEISWDLDDAPIDKGNARRGKKRFTVEIGYDDHGLNQSTMLKEIVTMRGSVPDWTPDRWAEYMYKVGNIPFWVACGDPDRYYNLIYAAEILRENPDFKAHGRRFLRQSNPEFDPYTRDVKQEGSLWGGVDDDFGGPGPEPTVAIAHVTVREQVDQKEKSVIENSRPIVKPAEPWQPNEQDTIYIAKWKKAHEIAAKCSTRGQVEKAIEKIGEHEGQEHFELMINYCYDWLCKTGDVPKYPFELTDLFWPRPKIINGHDRTIKRRAIITKKVISFWQKQLAKKEKGFDPKLHTYRAVRACIKLDEAIEGYASNWQRGKASADGTEMVYEVSHEEWEKRVRGAARLYYESKFPLKLEGVDPGPLDTLDPSYVDYILLCRKYGIKEGVPLHKIKFDKD